MSFGVGVTFFVGIYLIVILTIGYLARRARPDENLGEFYLAGRTLGGFVLLLTLYATQYSGNSLLGYPGEAYRLGFAWIMSVGFMMAIVVAYLIFAPQLYAQAKRHHFVTPGDWLDHRFGSPRLSLFANVLLVLGIGNYLLAQLMAMGHVIAGLTDQAVPYWMGVIVLTLVIILYETMGGMRAVAWTDAMQGLMLLLGIVGILIAAVPSPAHLRETTEWILSQQPDKVAVPSWSLCATWISSVLLIGFSGAVYPHAIQRIYAAHSTKTLRRALSIMIFMPLVTTFPMFLIGILSIRRFTDLGVLQADQVMPMLLRQWSSESTWMYAMAILVVVGTVAAIMSTADSVLLSISSILAKDFAGKTFMRDAPEARLTRLGKLLSWGVMLVLLPIALAPRITLWGLIELKMEILAQVSPLFLLGLTWKRLTTRAAFAGMIAGTIVAGTLFLGGYRMVGGLHAGLIGWAVNLTLSVVLSLIETGKRRPERDDAYPSPVSN